MNAFLPADILFPQVDSMEKWAVIACDQFTSDPAYWAVSYTHLMPFSYSRCRISRSAPGRFIRICLLYTSRCV